MSKRRPSLRARQARNQPLRPALSPHQQETRPNFVASLQSVSVEDLAALCAELAQEKGFTEPYTLDQKRDLLELAYYRLGSRRYERHQARHAAVAARRRAKIKTGTFEKFTRAEIIERDRSICHLCGKVCAPNEIHIDHVIPLSKGGTHTRGNVKVACATCNISKGASIPSDPNALLAEPDSASREAPATRTQAGTGTTR